MGTAMNRLLWWHWLLIGIGASLILFLILLFAVVKPKLDTAASVQGEAANIEQAGGTPEAVDQKKRELKTAQAETVRINQAWKVESSAYMPPIDFHPDPLPSYEGVQNIGVYRINGKSYGVKDLPAVWGRWITYWYASQWRDGIVPLTGFPIESFSADPNDVSTLKSISFPQTKPWDVEVVAKSFDAAMNHLRRFNGLQRHGMPVVDKVALNGQSPDLHMRYTLQLYVIPPSAPPAPDPKISGSGGSTGGGGGFMGGSGGMMGGSGAMMGGPPGGKVGGF
jgi:uncharacterized membrane protein YgcG